MPVYEISGDEISHLSYGRLADLKRGERKDFLKLMRENIKVISDDFLLISDDSDKWNKSEKIDLLAIDKNKNLVVVEVLEAGEDEEQDLHVVRYGTLVSKMSFAKLVSIYKEHISRVKSGIDAKKTILDHWDATGSSVKDSDSLNLRIFLVSREFSEGTIATVEWFQNGSLDVRCIEVASFEFTDRSIVDIVQIVPELDPAEVAKNLSKKPPVIAKKSESTSIKETETKEAVAKPEPVEAKSAPAKVPVAKTKPEPAKTKAPAPAAPKPIPTKAKAAESKPAPVKAKQSAAKPAPVKAKETTPKSSHAEVKKPTPNAAVTKSKPAVTKSEPAKKPAPAKSVTSGAKSKGKAESTKTAKKTQQLDRAKYIVSLNGKKQTPTAKRRAVLQALSHVLKSGVKPEKLPKRIAGTDDILVSVSGNVDGEKFKKLALVERKKQGRSFDPKRYFCQDDELLKLNGRTYAIINQWTLEAFTKIMALVKKDYPNLKISYSREEK